MITYYIQSNGTGSAFMVRGETHEETQCELWSLQNKGIALEADQIDELSFMFLCSKKKLEKAFFLQFIYKNWTDAESCELYKGEKGGFYADAKKFASEKFAQMKFANWLFTQRSLPEIYTSGKITAEKDSGNWNDVLTNVLQSV